MGVQYDTVGIRVVITSKLVHRCVLQTPSDKASRTWATPCGSQCQPGFETWPVGLRNR